MQSIILSIVSNSIALIFVAVRPCFFVYSQYFASYSILAWVYAILNSGNRADEGPLLL